MGVYGFGKSNVRVLCPFTQGALELGFEYRGFEFGRERVEGVFQGNISRGILSPFAFRVRILGKGAGSGQGSHATHHAGAADQGERGLHHKRQFVIRGELREPVERPSNDQMVPRKEGIVDYIEPGFACQLPRAFGSGIGMKHDEIMTGWASG